MKIRVLKQKIQQAGAALIVAMCIGAFLCICITGYLTVAEHQHYLSARSQAWNMSIAVTEAGVEEGLEALNMAATNHNTFNAAWQYDASSLTYYRSNYLNDGTGNSYAVTIYMTNANSPCIIARAFVTPPSLVMSEPTIFFADATAPSVSTGGTVTRAVRVTCSRANIFTAAFVAKHNIDLNGNNVMTDSYDSSSPGVKSNANGKWDSSIYSGDMGDVASNGGITNSVDIGNANIYGHLHTTPSLTPTIGPNGSVGTHAWGGTGFEPGYLIQDANFTFPDTSLPDTSSGYMQVPNNGTNIVSAAPSYSTNTTTYASYPSPVPTNTVSMTTNYLNQHSGVTSFTAPALGTYVPASLVINTNNNGSKQYTYTTYSGNSYSFSTWSVTYNYTTNYYDHILSAGTKYVSSSNLTGKVYLNGSDITLVLPQGLTGNENVTWSYGASLTIYSGGTSISLDGSKYFNQYNGWAGSLVVYAAPTVSSFTLNGNAQFTGILVAPSADLTLNGGGGSAVDFEGSLMVNSAKLNGHFNFHYDEALQNYAKNGRYLIASWNEIN